METLVDQKKSLILILVKQRQNFAWVYNLMLTIVTYFLGSISNEFRRVDKYLMIKNRI